MRTFVSLIFMNTTTSYTHNTNAFTEDGHLIQQTFLNVAYGKDPLQVMDIYLPEGRTVYATKSLILIHGGGWTSGSKADFVTYIDSFKHRLPDYAIFNMDYRLTSGGHIFPAQEQDVKAALDFIAAGAGTYGVSSENFVLLGVSAGAHLALLQAYKHSRPKIKAVVDYFGPADLVAMYQNPWHPLVPLALQMVTGTSPLKNKELYTSSSPVYFVTQQSPPTLILHGGRDAVVDISQSELLAKKLKSEGVRCQVEVFPAERHGRWYGSALTTSFDFIEKFLGDVVA